MAELRIGTLKELKNREYRVCLTPQGAQEFVRAGHSVYVETGAGKGVDMAIASDPHIAAGVNIADEKIIHPEIISAMAGQLDSM